MRMTCGACGSANVRARTRGRNPTGETKDAYVEVLVTCLDCTTERDASAEIAQAEASGDEVVIGAQRLRRTVVR